MPPLSFITELICRTPFVTGHNGFTSWSVSVKGIHVLLEGNVSFTCDRGGKALSTTIEAQPLLLHTNVANHLLISFRNLVKLIWLLVLVNLIQLQLSLQKKNVLF